MTKDKVIEFAKEHWDDIIIVASTIAVQIGMLNAYKKWLNK